MLGKIPLEERQCSQLRSIMIHDVDFDSKFRSRRSSVQIACQLYLKEELSERATVLSYFLFQGSGCFGESKRFATFDDVRNVFLSSNIHGGQIYEKKCDY